MKLLLIAALFLFTSSVEWSGNFADAKQQAAASHKMMLVNFSGSDWCGPCIRLRKEILESETFENYAKENLVLVRADFPCSKKNELPADQVKRNNSLADQYNRDGIFPYTLLLDENGKVVKSWNGYPNETPDAFVQQIKDAYTK